MCRGDDCSLSAHMLIEGRGERGRGQMVAYSSEGTRERERIDRLQYPPRLWLLLRSEWNGARRSGLDEIFAEQNGFLRGQESCYILTFLEF